jgi:hypothetical protein
MIDTAIETLIRLQDLAEHLPRNRNGKKIHISTLYRWASRGVRGAVLETVTIGGTRYTSLQALRRFSRPGASIRSVRPNRAAQSRAQAKQRASARAAQILGVSSDTNCSMSKQVPNDD